MASYSRFSVLLFIFFYFPFSYHAAAQRNGFKIFLVGDAGENAYTGKALENLGKQLKENPNSAVIFLGDNCYKNDIWGIFPYGFKGFDSSMLTQKKIHAQLDILSGYKGYVFFVPGNHDWWNITNAEKGIPKLKMEESFIESNLGANKTIANPGRTFIPKNGSPGPEFIDLDSVRLIFADTYRLIITDFKKNQQEDYPLEKVFYSKLDSLMKDAGKKNFKIIISGHQTLFAKGHNSKPLKTPNLFARIKASNINFPAYHRMVLKVRALLKQYPGSYYACGHVHSLQYFMPEDSVHYIVSGAGSKTDYVSADEIRKNVPIKGKEFLQWNSQGFFEIDFSSSPEKIFMYYDNGEKKREIN
jgi:hypothetical protein